jgi:hypothetical protein
LSKKDSQVKFSQQTKKPNNLRESCKHGLIFKLTSE